MPFISPNGNAGGLVKGDSGDNFISAAGGDDQVVAVGGDDSIRGGVGDDSLKGGTGEDSINGGEGNDSINGGAGDDHIAGGLGNDKIAGGMGDDIISGGAGNNKMFGGDGADIFVFGSNSEGKDKIFDFEVGVDKVRLEDVSAVDFKTTSQGATVTLDTGGVIIMKGLSIEEAMAAFRGQAPEVAIIDEYDDYPAELIPEFYDLG